MAIDDVGANPRKLAEAIIKQLPDGLKSTPVREIARAIDIYEIREEKLSGLEGALIVSENKSEGSILINSESSPQRKRFTIAHEIGHYVNPTHRANSNNKFECTRNDMRVAKARPGDKRAKMELQANQFAAELLMPTSWLKEFLRGKLGADIAHILELAIQFEVSKEAASRCYLASIDESAAIIFSKAGVIRYVKKKNSFPRLSVWNGDNIPQDCISSASSRNVGEVTDVVETPGHIWLETSEGLSLGEQTLAQQDNYRMTMLTVEEVDDEENEWSPPKFGR